VLTAELWPRFGNGVLARFQIRAGKEKPRRSAEPPGPSCGTAGPSIRGIWESGPAFPHLHNPILFLSQWLTLLPPGSSAVSRPGDLPQRFQLLRWGFLLSVPFQITAAAVYMRIIDGRSRRLVDDVLVLWPVLHPLRRADLHLSGFQRSATAPPVLEHKHRLCACRRIAAICSR
jgi:hypothetical protein